MGSNVHRPIPFDALGRVTEWSDGLGEFRLSYGTIENDAETAVVDRYQYFYDVHEMKRHIKVYIIAISGIGIVGLAGFAAERAINEAKGKRVVRAIESFRTQTGRLPNSLSEISGLEEEGIFYEKDGAGYIVWFGERLGESRVFRSSSGKWVSTDD